jgi:hypothetical protein
MKRTNSVGDSVLQEGPDPGTFGLFVIFPETFVTQALLTRIAEGF